MTRSLRFKKGIYRINIPFMLNSHSPWQEQIEQEMDRAKKNFKVRKSAWWGFEITQYGAMVVCYRD